MASPLMERIPSCTQLGPTQGESGQPAAEGATAPVNSQATKDLRLGPKTLERGAGQRPPKG